MKKIKSCIACHSIEFENFGTPLLHLSDSKYNVIKCKNCGLMWCDPMSVENYDEYYQKYYEHRTATCVENKIKKHLKKLINWQNASHNSFLKLVEKFSKKGTLVDYGFGEGTLLYRARERGWQTIGVEYTSEISDKLRKDGFEIHISANIDSCSIEENTVDCFVAKHLLEHLTDLDEFLFKVKKYLKAEGVFAIKTPSNNSINAKLGITKWHLINPPEHQWSFNLNSFRVLMESCNYEIIYLKNSLIVNELICIAKPRTK
jgi:2-polyprenyl-3-methyl-5-hydroxy-6-metoxy-1,4-benzoquinol methylase